MIVQHPTIIKLHGFSDRDIKDQNCITIVMDKMDNGSLSYLLKLEMKSQAPIAYDETKRQIILAGVARGMMILHAANIAHRDLKPSKVLLDDDLEPRITDFGLLKIFDPYSSSSQSMRYGTFYFQAPETINSNKFDGKAADVYAFSILMYEVVERKDAFDFKDSGKITPHNFELKILNGYRPSFDCQVKKSIRDLIEQCWSQDPNKRPTFSEIFN